MFNLLQLKELKEEMDRDHIFPKEEYAFRFKKARDLMKKEGLDALLVTEPRNYFYLSGHRSALDVCSLSNNWTVAILLPVDQDPLIIADEMFKDDIVRESYIKEAKLHSGFPRTVTNVLKDLTLDRGIVGLELGLEQRLGMSYNDLLELKELLPRTRFVDAAQILWALRMKKSAAEIECIRTGCSITGEAIDKCFCEAKEGMTEKEFSKKLFGYMMEFGADRPAFVVMNSGAGNYDRISGLPTDRRFRQGDAIWVDAGTIYNGYYSDMSRRAVVGAPSARQKKQHGDICLVTQSCIEMVRPGIKVSDILEVCDEELRKIGISQRKEKRIGHGVGLMCVEPPYIDEETAITLEPGMVFTIEPGFVSEEGFFVVEQDVLVTDHGHEILTKASNDLRVV